MTAEAGPEGTSAALVLAAGASRRFGSPKALIDVDGLPLVVHLVRLYARVCEEVLVVTGSDAEAVGPALAGEPARRVHNAEHERGVLSSIAVGARALGEGGAGPGRVLLGPVDLPLADEAAPRRLLAEARGCEAAVLVPAFLGTLGYPLCLAARALALLAGLAAPADAAEEEQAAVLAGDVADGGISRFGRTHPLPAWMRRVEVDDVGVVFNLNRPEHLERWRAVRRRLG